MSRYDYECNTCGYIFEVMHPMIEEPKINCEKCKGNCSRLISCGKTTSFIPPPNFIDIDTTGKPIKFTSWKKYDKHLKSLGLSVVSKPRSMSDLDSMVRKSQRRKMESFREEVRPLVRQALKEKEKWLPKEQFYRRSNG